MPYLLVPHEVSATQATIWIGAVDERVGGEALTCEPGAGRHPLDEGWERWETRPGGRSIAFQRVTVSGLRPRTTYSLALHAGGHIEASGTVTTFPESLPGPGERPFVVLLGSCFYAREDKTGRAGNAFFHVPAALRPDVKFLSGDQVYLDAPWLHFLVDTHSEEQMREEFLDTYLRSWSQQGPAMGLGELLRHGATYFCSDDHDLWNSAPNKCIYARDTWTDSGRDRWLRVARDLYRVFQSTALVRRFSVGTLSFLVLDTRLERRADRSQFMPPESMLAVEEWISGLNGPGVLVCGQPIFAERAGIKGHLTDWELPDYDQYPSLVRLLAATRHSIVILTGDVHFGRVATCRLPSGLELLEVISSPLALVDKAVGGSWKKAPDFFPSFDIPGMVKAPVQTETYALTDNHFLTLEFSAMGGGVSVVVRAWPITEGGTIERSTVVYRRPGRAGGAIH